MQKRFRISVDGRGYDVIVEEMPLDPAAVTATFAAPAAPVAVASAAVAAPVAAPAAAAPAAAGAEVAPLAGVVESVVVSVGQTIAAGDKIAVIEAMKMKTEVFAKGAGSVVSIAVKPGDAVDGGATILTLG